MIRSHRVTGPCMLVPVTGMHWHHECWNCGRDICAGGIGVPGSYTCRCDCGENEALGHIQTDVSFDREMAATLSSPG